MGVDKLIIGDYTCRDAAIERIDEISNNEVKPIENLNVIIDFIDPQVLKNRISVVVQPNKTIESASKRFDEKRINV